MAGSPGGRSIPATVLRIVTAVVDHGLSPREAVELLRVHHGLYPDRLDIEEAAPAAVKASLSARGHALHTRAGQGDAHVVGIEPSTGRLVGAADGRRAGAPAPPPAPGDGAASR